MKISNAEFLQHVLRSEVVSLRSSTSFLTAQYFDVREDHIRPKLEVLGPLLMPLGAHNITLKVPQE